MRFKRLDQVDVGVLEAMVRAAWRSAETAT